MSTTPLAEAQALLQHSGHDSALIERELADTVPPGRRVACRLRPVTGRRRTV
jgi:hypothetical protein